MMRLVVRRLHAQANEFILTDLPFSHTVSTGSHVMSTVLYFLLALFINPFVPAALRNWQSCCFQFAAGVALYLSPFFILSFSVRLIPWFAKYPLLRRILSWGGLGLWCLGALISSMHAFS